MSNEDPKPGTPEYDAAMAARFQQQSRGDTPLTDDGSKATSYYTPEGGGVQIHKESTLGPKHTTAQEHYSAAAADPGQVIDMERERDRLKAELAEVRGYDQRTGEARFRIEGEPRRGRELRLQAIEAELPKVRALQEHAAAWRAANVPTTAEKLQAEKARKDAVSQSAETIANEREAWSESEMILRSRRLGIGR